MNGRRFNVLVILLSFLAALARCLYAPEEDDHVY